MTLLRENVGKLKQRFEFGREGRSSDDLRHFVGFREGGSGSLVVEVRRRVIGAASDDLRLSGV